MDHLNLESVKIGQLWNSPTGSMLEYQVKEAASFPPQDAISLTSPLTLDLKLVKIDSGIAAQISQLKVQAELTCSRCLAPVAVSLELQDLERCYLATAPLEEVDLDDSFKIDLKELSINLLDLIREEIILHFPMIPVCSTHCKGLCSDCGANLNRETHLPACNLQVLQPADNELYKPFANLKDIIK